MMLFLVLGAEDTGMGFGIGSGFGGGFGVGFGVGPDD